MENTVSDFTEGKITGKLIKFMIPILGSLILQAAYGAVDVLMVGWFGTTDCSHRQACGVLVDRLAPCPYTILRLWDQGCRPEQLNCRPSTPLGTLATGFCLSAWRDSQLPHIISIFLLTLKFLLLEPLFRC